MPLFNKGLDLLDVTLEPGLKSSPRSTPTIWEKKGVLESPHKRAARENLERLKALYRSGALCFCQEIDDVNHASNTGRKLPPRARK